MEQKLLFLKIETTARELDAKLLLGYQALIRDYSVVIGNSIIKNVAEKIGHGIFFYNDHKITGYPQKRKFLFNVALDEEGLLFSDIKSFLNRSIPNSLKHLDLIFTWGKYQKDLLVNNNRIDLKHKVKVIGNPRFDLLRPKFSKIFEPISNVLKRKWGQYILINTNFVLGNLSPYYKYNNIMEYMYRYGIVKTTKDYEFYLNKQNYYKLLLNSYIEMVKELSRKFPKINFILRPHPSENHTTWKKALRGFNNIFVIYEGTAVDWIYGALGVIHTGCTTGIEAWALNRPVFRYNPKPEKKYESELPNKFGYNLSSITDLETAIRKTIDGTIKGTFKVKEERSIAKPYINNIDGKFSSERILDVFDDLWQNSEKKFPNRKIISFKFKNFFWIDGYKKFIREIVAKLLKKTKLTEINLFKRFLSPFSPFIGASFQKFSGINSKYIQYRFQQFDNIFNNSILSNLIIKKIAFNSFVLQRET